MTSEVNEFSLFKDFPHPVFMISSDGTILEANQPFVETFFSGVVEIRNKNVFELIANVLHDPELSASRKARLDTVLSTGRYVIFDDEHADGRIIRSSIYPVKSPEGDISRLLIIAHDVTKEIKSERQARHTDCIFKALLDAIPSSVFILDDEGLLLSCNNYAFELFGDRHGRIENNNFFNLVLDEDRARIQTKLTTLFVSGHEAVDEVRMHIHEDRNRFSWFTIHTRKTVIDNCDYLVLVCIDISQIKLSESHLFEYKKWLIMAMEAGNTGVWDWNIVTDAALWSNRLWKLYGIERHPGQHPSFKLWETSIHSDDREMVVQSVRQAVFLLADLNIEYRVVHPDGSVRWILANGKPVYDKHGVVKRYCGTSIDITDQKQFEDDMTLIREHLDFVLEKFHIGWFHLNLQDHSAVRTIEHARIFGYESMDTEWSFEKFLEHVVDEDRQRVKNLVFDSISNNEDYTTECRIRRANGETRRIWASGSLIYDDRGKPTHIVGIVQDVTGRSVQ